MLKGLLNDPASVALAKAMSGAAKRQEALAQNIANVETPGYTRQEVPFEAALESALSSAEADPNAAAAHVDALEFGAAPDTSTPAGADGNNVNVEHEMSELAKNSLRFDASATVLALKIRQLRAAISEGRR